MELLLFLGGEGVLCPYVGVAILYKRFFDFKFNYQPNMCLLYIYIPLDLQNWQKIQND